MASRWRRAASAAALPLDLDRADFAAGRADFDGGRRFWLDGTPEL
jgi:hypothetical protein